MPQTQPNAHNIDDRKRPIRLMVADDQPVILRGLSMILNAEDDIEVVAQAKDGLEAEQLALKTKPDVIVMDLNMPKQSGVVATRNIHSVHPEISIIVLTTFDDDESVFQAVRAGALSYLLKDVSEDEIVETVRAVQNGETYLSPRIARKVMEQFRADKLIATKTQSAKHSTPEEPVTENENTSAGNPTEDLRQLTAKEQQILELIAQGLSNKQIGENVFLAEGTVKNYVSRIMAKLHARSRTELAVHAVTHRNGGR